MTFQKDCEESIRLFGRPYEEVHNRLDEFAGIAEKSSTPVFCR